MAFAETTFQIPNDAKTSKNKENASLSHNYVWYTCTPTILKVSVFDPKCHN